MLSRGTAARRRSTSVRSAGVVRAVTTAIRESVGGCAEHGARIEVGIAPDEATGHLGKRAGVDDQSEPLARSVGNRDENSVWLRAREDSLDLLGAAQHRHTLQPSPRKSWIVVHEAHDLFAGGLAKLA